MGIRAEARWLAEHFSVRLTTEQRYTLVDILTEWLGHCDATEQVLRPDSDFDSETAVESYELYSTCRLVSAKSGVDSPVEHRLSVTIARNGFLLSVDAMGLWGLQHGE